MGKFIKENWFKVGLIAIMIIFVAGAFYWYSWRPTQIKKRCFADANIRGGFTTLGKSRVSVNADYEDCLLRFGLR